jgi:hypothetical protein
MSDTESTTVETDPQKAKSEAFSAAGKRLRETNREQYVRFVAEEMKARGIEWAPKPTAAEKAAAEAKALLEAHPEIAAELRSMLG